MIAVTHLPVKLKLDYCSSLSIPRLLAKSVCHLCRKQQFDEPWGWALVLTICSSPEKKLFTLAGFWRSEWDLLTNLRVILQHSVFLVFLCDCTPFEINFPGLWRSKGLLILLDSKCQPTTHIHPVSRVSTKNQNLPGSQGFAGLPSQ